RHVHMRGACIADARTRRRLMVGALWDVTDRHAHELELERFAGHLAATYATSSLAIFVTTRDVGRIVEVNDAAVAMTGYSRQALLERTVLDLGFWDEPGEPFERFARRLHHGRVLHRNSRFERRDGAQREVQVSATLIDRHGEAYVLHMVDDVTERRRQKVALRESEERFARIFQISPDPIALMSADGRVIEANPEFLRFSQYDVEALRSKTTVELGLWSEPGGSDLVAHLATEQNGQDVECVLRKKSGELAPCQISWSGFDFAAQRYVLLIAHDITELKRHASEVDELNASLEKMVQARTAQLQSANRELESFSYSVSHDLRAPLRHIAGFASLLRERPAMKTDEEAVRLIGVVIRAAGRMGALIDDLLSFSRVSRQQMAMQEVSLEEIVRDIVQEISTVETQREVRWSIGELPVVRGDRQLLRSVALNLLDNALKYTRPRPVAVIEIGSETHDGYANVYVRDNGVGFDMQYAEKLFGVFQRLHTPEEFEGTGVGLASVERIVERHGGHVWAQGKPNEGATFWFSLPLARATNESVEKSEDAHDEMEVARGTARPVPGENHASTASR
ncbi:MAG TPA: PAS domain S-box protein, partial [Burkholderiales bacterium]